MSWMSPTFTFRHSYRDQLPHLDLLIPTPRCTLPTGCCPLATVCSSLLILPEHCPLCQTLCVMGSHQRSQQETSCQERSHDPYDFSNVASAMTIFPLRSLPREMLAPLNARHIQLGRSIFNWGPQGKSLCMSVWVCG